MKSKLVLGFVLSSMITSFAVASGGPPFDFEFTAPGGLLPLIWTDPDGPGPLQADGTTGFSVFTLNMSPLPMNIQSLELVLNGLSHTAPADLNVYLISPIGTQQLLVMRNRGDQQSVNGLTVVFSDKSPGFPPTPLGSGPYKPEDQQGPHGSVNFASFNGLSGGPGPWYLLISDDSLGNRGSLESWTLRGTVPEPVTLSLLALGALAIVRRRGA